MRRFTSAAVLLLTGAILGTSCSGASGTTSVDAGGDLDGVVPLPTTTIVNRTTTTTTTVAPTTAVPRAQLNATLASIVGQIAADPQMAATLGALHSGDLATMFGVEADLLTLLGIDAETVRGLGSILMGAQPEVLAELAGLGGVTAAVPDLGQALPQLVDMAAIAELLAYVEQINGAALASIQGLTQPIVLALVDMIDSVDPAFQQQLASLLTLIDPAGLGQMAQNQPEMASVLAAIAAAVLASDPAIGDAIRQAYANNPQLIEVLIHLEALGATLDPAIAAAVVVIGSQLNEGQMFALAGLLDLLANPLLRELLRGIVGTTA